MTYDPRAYWTRRAQEQGPSYVGPGGHKGKTAGQAESFEAAIRDALGDDTFGCILDFGCGVGRFAPLLADRCDWYVGTDISRPALEHAPDLPNAYYHWMPNDRIPFDGQAGLVVAITVFQHIVDDGDFRHWAREVGRVLAPDGQVLVIDNAMVDNPNPHMHPRTPEDVGESLGLAPVLVHNLGGHWLARYRRGKD